LRVFFIGATNLGLMCLETLLALDDIDVVGVLTAPKEFRISYSEGPISNVQHADFEPIARAHNLPLFYLVSSMAEEHLGVKVFQQEPDCFLVVGWYHMIPAGWMLDTPSFGLHASLLPRYRGGAPLVWAMINGETRTGVTLFQMDNGVDTGPIFSSREIEISCNDEIADVLGKAEEAALEIVRLDLPAIALGKLAGRPQPDGDYPVMPQRSPLDGEIDWSQPAEFVSRFIRAQTKPYPGTFFQVSGHRVIVWRASVLKAPDLAESPGTLFSYSGNFVIKCEDTLIQLDNFEIEGSQARAEHILRGLARQLDIQTTLISNTGQDNG
jgi:methionyl-tRNA formyltransferase